MVQRTSQAVIMAELDSPVGVLVAGVTDEGVCLLEFRDREILDAQVAWIGDRVGPVKTGRNTFLELLRSQL